LVAWEYRQCQQLTQVFARPAFCMVEQGPTSTMAFMCSHHGEIRDMCIVAAAEEIVRLL
jgi:hypothetical protein